MRSNSAEILFPVFFFFLRKTFVSVSGMGRDVQSLMLSIQHFRSRPQHRPPSQGVLRDGLGEVVVACDMPEPREFPSLDSCQKRFPWTHKEIDIAPLPVVGLVLKEGDTEKFSPAFGFEGLGPFLRV